MKIKNTSLLALLLFSFSQVCITADVVVQPTLTDRFVDALHAISDFGSHIRHNWLTYTKPQNNTVASINTAPAASAVSTDVVPTVSSVVTSMVSSASPVVLAEDTDVVKDTTTTISNTSTKSFDFKPILTLFSISNADSQMAKLLKGLPKASRSATQRLQSVIATGRSIAKKSMDKVKAIMPQRVSLKPVQAPVSLPAIRSTASMKVSQVRGLSSVYKVKHAPVDMTKIKIKSTPVVEAKVVKGRAPVINTGIVKALEEVTQKIEQTVKKRAADALKTVKIQKVSVPAQLITAAPRKSQIATAKEVKVTRLKPASVDMTKIKIVENPAVTVQKTVKPAPVISTKIPESLKRVVQQVEKPVASKNVVKETALKKAAPQVKAVPKPKVERKAPSVRKAAKGTKAPVVVQARIVTGPVQTGTHVITIDPADITIEERADATEKKVKKKINEKEKEEKE